jgi:hypothetical protein
VDTSVQPILAWLDEQQCFAGHQLAAEDKAT